jgi:hypothetical protein
VRGWSSRRLFSREELLRTLSVGDAKKSPSGHHCAGLTR